MQLDAAESNAMSRIGAALEDLDPDRQSRVMFALANTATPPWLDPDDTLGPTREQQIRIAALTFAASITQHADGMSFRDVEQTSIGMADRAAGWIATGAYDWMAAPSGVDFGPGVACSCGPDSVTHVHEDPWGCTTCGCRFYVAFEANAEAFAAGRREAAAAIRTHIIAGARLPEWARAGATPNATAIREWAARIAEGIDQTETPADCGCRAYDPVHNHHTAAQHTSCNPGADPPCGGCDSCIGSQAYHLDQLAKETGDA